LELRDQIAFLDRVLEEHIRKWERFFAGVEKVPPQIERERLSRRIRMLSEQTANRRADHFRIEQMQHRFQTYSMNWERMLREREEGRSAAAGHTNPALRAPEAANVPAAATVEHREEDVLFDRYCAAKAEQGVEVKVDRKTFDEQIASQRQRIEERLGRKVHFEVQVEDGKVRVVARKMKRT
jgi:hypothetical protein